MNDNNNVENYKALLRDGVLSREEFEKLTGISGDSIVEEKKEAARPDFAKQIEASKTSNAEIVSQPLNEVNAPLDETLQSDTNKNIIGKHKSSKLPKTTIACYVIAAIALVHCLFVIINTTKQVNDYYAAYNASAGFVERSKYIFDAVFEPFISAVLIFMTGKIYAKIEK